MSLEGENKTGQEGVWTEKEAQVDAKRSADHGVRNGGSVNLGARDFLLRRFGVHGLCKRYFLVCSKYSSDATQRALLV